MRYTPQGTPIITSSVAVNKRHKASGESIRENMGWFNIVVRNKLAETTSKNLVLLLN